MSEAVKNLFTDISPTYDKLNHFLSLNMDKRWRRSTLSRITKTAEEPFQALDVCAGTHDMGIECLRNFPKATVTALDFSPGMLEAGRSKVLDAIRKRKILPVCADALNMPFADNTFDVAFCAYGVRNFDDTAAGIREIRRVLKPGGQLLVLEFFRPASRAGTFFHNTYGRHVLPRVGALVSGHRSAYTYLRDSIQKFVTLEEFSELLMQNGFDNVTTKNFFMAVSTVVSSFRK